MKNRCLCFEGVAGGGLKWWGYNHIPELEKLKVLPYSKAYFCTFELEVLITLSKPEPSACGHSTCKQTWGWRAEGCFMYLQHLSNSHLAHLSHLRKTPVISVNCLMYSPHIMQITMAKHRHMYLLDILGSFHVAQCNSRL